MTKRMNDASTVKNGGRKFKNDLIFIACLLTVVALVGAGFFFFRKEGDLVTVTVDGEVFGRYSLSENIRVDIVTGKDGEAHNVLVIENGVAYVVILCERNSLEVNGSILKRGLKSNSAPNFSAMLV